MPDLPEGVKAEERDALIAAGRELQVRAEKAEAERDEAAQQERERLREALDSAAKAPLPTEVWGEHGEESWWRQGRDETVAHVRKALDILAALPTSQPEEGER